MITKPIQLIVPEPDYDPGDEPIETLFISPEGADPDREVPGFFVIQIDGVYILADENTKSLPKQYPSLDAVHFYLREKYGWKIPLRVTTYVQTRKKGPRDFPAIWGAERKIGKKRVLIRARYIGSFRYWSGRPVDPRKVGTSAEFN